MPVKKPEKAPSSPYSRKIIMSVLAFVLAAGGYGGYEVAKTYGKYGTNFDKRPHVVEEVVDGDTLIIEDGIRIRLIGVDAPEQGECFAEEAKQGISKMILGREIILEKDEVAVDGYDRLLRYVFLHDENPRTGNTFLNEMLVREGLARSEYVQPNRLYLRRLQAAEREAKEKKAGAWIECDIPTNEDSLAREEDTKPWSDECGQGQHQQETPKGILHPRLPQLYPSENRPAQRRSMVLLRGGGGCGGLAEERRLPKPVSEGRVQADTAKV